MSYSPRISQVCWNQITNRYKKSQVSAGFWAISPFPAVLCCLKWKWKCESVSHSVVSNSLWPHWLYSLPGSSVHEILQAIILEWVAIPFSRGSSWPRDRTHVSCTAGGFFTIWATRVSKEKSHVLLSIHYSGGRPTKFGRHSNRPKFSDQFLPSSQSKRMQSYGRRVLRSLVAKYALSNW